MTLVLVGLLLCAVALAGLTLSLLLSLLGRVLERLEGSSPPRVAPASPFDEARLVELERRCHHATTGRHLMAVGDDDADSDR